MEKHDISEYLTYDELAFIAGDMADADYKNFDDATKHDTTNSSRLGQKARQMAKPLRSGGVNK